MRHPSEDDGVVSNKQDSWSFKYHDVLHNASQDTVYDTLASEIVRGVITGTNGTIEPVAVVTAVPAVTAHLLLHLHRCPPGTIMAYGQTGAGKTFTMVTATTA